MLSVAKAMQPIPHQDYAGPICWILKTHHHIILPKGDSLEGLMQGISIVGGQEVEASIRPTQYHS